MSIVTLRYAHAFSDAARAGGLDAGIAQRQLGDVADTLAGSSELREFLGNPSIQEDDKLRILDAITQKIGVYPQVRNLVAVVMDHGRLHQLHEIVTEYGALADEQAAVTDAEVTTARPLAEADRAVLEERLRAIAGGVVRAAYHEDAHLLGGVMVRMGSTVYDGSIRGQMEQLKQRLVNA